MVMRAGPHRSWVSHWLKCIGFGIHIHRVGMLSKLCTLLIHSGNSPSLGRVILMLFMALKLFFCFFLTECRCRSPGICILFVTYTVMPCVAELVAPWLIMGGTSLAFSGDFPLCYQNGFPAFFHCIFDVCLFKSNPNVLMMCFQNISYLSYGLLSGNNS